MENKVVFFFLFYVKFVVRGEQWVQKRSQLAHSDHGAGVGGHVTRRSAWSPDCPRPIKRKERQNVPVETIEKMSEGWKCFDFLSFGGGSFSQYCWFFVAYLCVAFFCYKRRLKKEKKSVFGWSLYSGRGWGDAPIRRHFYSMVHSAFISVNHLLYSLACPCPRREWLNKIKLLQFHSHVL